MVDAIERALLDGRASHRFQQALDASKPSQNAGCAPLERFDASLLRSPESLAVVERLEEAASARSKSATPRPTEDQASSRRGRTVACRR